MHISARQLHVRTCVHVYAANFVPVLMHMHMYIILWNANLLCMANVFHRGRKLYM